MKGSLEIALRVIYEEVTKLQTPRGHEQGKRLPSSCMACHDIDPMGHGGRGD